MENTDFPDTHVPRMRVSACTSAKERSGRVLEKQRRISMALFNALMAISLVPYSGTWSQILGLAQNIPQGEIYGTT